jgi:hypothetical protein
VPLLKQLQAQQQAPKLAAAALLLQQQEQQQQEQEQQQEQDAAPAQQRKRARRASQQTQQANSSRASEGTGFNLQPDLTRAAATMMQVGNSTWCMHAHMMSRSKECHALLGCQRQQKLVQNVSLCEAVADKQACTVVCSFLQ